MPFCREGRFWREVLGRVCGKVTNCAVLTYIEVMVSGNVTEGQFRNLKGRAKPLERAMLFLSVRIRARTAGGIPASRTAHDRTPGRFCLRQMSASSIVATPHCGACSFSDDLTSDGISATGCPQRFAPLGHRFLHSPSVHSLWP